jgi:hypothetical protein
VTKLTRAPCGRVAQPRLAGGRSDHHDDAWSLPSLPDDEPVSLGVACPEDLRPAIELGRSNLRVVVEVTERAVAGDPARVLVILRR